MPPQRTAPEAETDRLDGSPAPPPREPGPPDAPASPDPAGRPEGAGSRPRSRSSGLRVVTIPDAANPSFAGESSRRRWLFLTVLLVVALVAVGAMLLVRGPETDGPSAGGSPVPPAPERLAPDTSYVATRVREDGDLVVQHWIRSRDPVYGLTLAVPSTGADRQGTAHGVELFADGRRVPGPRTVTGQPAHYFALGATHVYVRYRLRGALERSTSAPGRALARTTALRVDLTRSLASVRQAIGGAKVLAGACTPRVTDIGFRPVPCGAPVGDGWSVDLSGQHVNDAVTVQLDLR
ncbi:hypothetical protein EKO23_07180 [Nocardioides guangzhouensis]|uniref:Uncharacterized protein n=1 Tax=Nocardioides guangzhouensis TaxID=2497878 RepID=A0A4Q4ZHT3_9ACTN|nr:hypothetical protein [Nocardioides guangzhouensis]RYP87051.1 hypothetical protein EKO23_07180 [Nocardioides guangzhouensis]